MGKLVLITVLVMVAGCVNLTAVYPYAKVGIGLVNDRSTSMVLRTGCDGVTVWHQENWENTSCGGRNPAVHLAGGYEFQWSEGPAWWKVDSCELNHWSHLRDGPPRNNNGETSKNEVVCYTKIGGRP